MIPDHGPCSRRSYQVQFAKWKFPHKTNPAYKNEQLIERIRQLWEQNLSQPEMLSALANEGYQVGEREVERIRSKNGWMLRRVTGTFNSDQRPSQSAGDDGDGDGDGDGDDREDQEVRDQSTYWNYGATGLDPVGPQAQHVEVHAQPPEDTLEALRQARRDSRKRANEAEYHERWVAKKRRRHTRPFAGLPADPPGPPRFPSETTLTEAKEILQLDKKAYEALREQFYAICANAGVYKKTLAGPERWEALKDQLVRQSMHLRSVMWDPTDMEKKKLAVEIIAANVTKRLRVESSLMTVANAKVMLGLNPEEARIVRGQLYNILAQERFTSMLEEGIEYFEELKQRWLAESDELRRALAAGASDPDFQGKTKAINVLCRDATSRYRGDMGRLGKVPEILNLQPAPKDKQAATPKPKVANAAPTQSEKATGKRPARAATSTPATVASPPEFQAATTPASPAPPRRRGRPPGSRNKGNSALPQAESRLILAGHEELEADQHMLDAQLETRVPDAPASQSRFADEQYVQGYAAAQQAQGYQQRQRQEEAAPAPSGAIAVFFRLSSASATMFPGVSPQWIAPLSSRTMADLRSAAVQKTPGALCYKVEGIVKDGRNELPLPVSDEVELETYLQHVQGHGAPTFNVHVVPGDDAAWS